MSEPDKRCGCKHPGCSCRFPDGFTLPTRCDKCGELMSAHGAYMVNRGWILTCPITREERPYPPGPDPRKPAPMCLNCGAELVRDPDTWECNRCGEGYALDDPRLSPAPPDPTPPVEADEERERAYGAAGRAAGEAVLEHGLDGAKRRPANDAFLLSRIARACVDASAKPLLSELTSLRAERDAIRQGKPYPDCWGDCGQNGYCCDGDWDQRRRAGRAEAERVVLREALSWALDVLDLCFKRLDTVDGPATGEHARMREAGMAKARAALDPQPVPVIAEEDVARVLGELGDKLIDRMLDYMPDSEAAQALSSFRFTHLPEAASELGIDLSDSQGGEG